MHVKREILPYLKSVGTKLLSLLNYIGFKIITLSISKYMKSQNKQVTVECSKTPPKKKMACKTSEMRHLTRSSEWLRFTRLPTFIVLQTIQRWNCVCVRSALGPTNSHLTRQFPTRITKIIPVKIIIITFMD